VPLVSHGKSAICFEWSVPANTRSRMPHGIQEHEMGLAQDRKNESITFTVVVFFNRVREGYSGFSTNAKSC
jgi:hypothetical protein